MAQEQLSTFGTTTLAITLLNTDTAGILTDGSVMPSIGNFILLIENEYILVTNISGGNITVTRGYAGTTVVTHSSGTTVKLVLSKEALANYFGDRLIFGGYSSLPSTGLRAGLIYYATDIDLAWYYDGSNWNLWHPVYVPYTNRVDLSGWTQVNAGGSTWTDYNGVLVASMPSHSGDLFRYWIKNIPSHPFTLNCIIERSSACSQLTGAGIGISNGTAHIAMVNYDPGDIQTVSVDRYTSDTGFNNISYRQNHWYPRMYFRIQDDNTNLNYFYSYDGLNYNKVYQEGRTAWFNTGATKVIIGANRRNTTYTGDEQYRFLGYWETTP